MMNIKWVTILIIAICAIGFILGRTTKKTVVQYIDRDVFQVDTVYTEVPKEIIKWLPALHDTVTNILTEVDTLWLDPPNEIVQFNTELVADSLIYGELWVSYYYPPWDKFNYKFKPEPLPMITKKIYVQMNNPWYTNPWLHFAMGTVTGVLVTSVEF